MLIPAAHAQQKTERAYAAFMRKVKVEARPNIVRDPQTMQLQGKGETYEFAIPGRDQEKMNLILTTVTHRFMQRLAGQKTGK